MKNYNQTMEILESFYDECVEYWNKQNSKVSTLNAIQDILNLENDPYSPNGAKLDKFAITDFIDKKISHL